MQPPRILIVDDEESIVFALRRFFVTRGFIVDSASALHDACRRVEEETFDAVIADLRLSAPEGTEGLQVIAAARRANPDVCSILLTAFNSPALLLEASRVGVDRVLHKPQPLAELASAVTSLLASRTGTPA